MTRLFPRLSLEHKELRSSEIFLSFLLWFQRQAFIKLIFLTVCDNCNGLCSKLQDFIRLKNFNMRSINDRDVLFLQMTAEMLANPCIF
jgi:hypothetical protein